MRILVTGASGQLGTDVLAELERRAAAVRRGPALEVLGASHGELDVTRRDAVLALVAAFEPDVIIHTAAFTAVDRCETEVDLAYAVNALGARYLAEAAAFVDAHLAYVSTDYVFDGTLDRPYHEWDEPNPLSVYGRSKLGGERALPVGATIVRTSWVCGASGTNIAKTVLRLARERQGALSFVDDQHGSPTMTADLAPVLIDLATSRRAGIFHVTNAGSTTWFGFAQEVLRLAGLDPARVEAVATADLASRYPAPRPANSVLDNAARRLGGDAPLAPWQEALERLISALER